MREPYEMSFEELLINAIQRRHAASCHEIVRRQVNAGKSLVAFTFDQILAINGSRPATQDVTNVIPLPLQGPGGFDGEGDSSRWDYKKEPWLKPRPDAPPVDLSDDPDPLCRLAREIIAQDLVKRVATSMDRSDEAEDYIYLAAGNPNALRDMPEKGLSFWRACVFAYDRVKVRRKFGA